MKYCRWVLRLPCLINLLAAIIMSTVNSIELRVNLRANNNEKSDQFGRLYAELERNRTLSLRGLAKHISEHGSVYTIDVVYGVLAKLCQCIPELLAQGQPVKLDGLGTFYPTALNVKGGLADIAAAKETNPTTVVEGVRVRYLPDGTKLDDMTSKAFKERCSLVWGNLIEITGYKTSTSGKTKSPLYKLTPISNPLSADPEPEP